MLNWYSGKTNVLEPTALARNVADLARRTFRYSIFAPCPRLYGHWQERARSQLEMAVAEFEKTGMPLDWSFHAYLLAWIRKTEGKVAEEIGLELLAATAHRWTIEDRSDAVGVLLVEDSCPGYWVGGWKIHSVRERKKTRIAKIPGWKPPTGLRIARLRDWAVPNTIESLSELELGVLFQGAGRS